MFSPGLVIYGRGWWEGKSETTFDYPEWMGQIGILRHAEFLYMRPVAFVEVEDCSHELQGHLGEGSINNSTRP